MFGRVKKIPVGSQKTTRRACCLVDGFGLIIPALPQCVLDCLTFRLWIYLSVNLERYWVVCSFLFFISWEGVGAMLLVYSAMGRGWSQCIHPNLGMGKAKL